MTETQVPMWRKPIQCFSCPNITEATNNVTKKSSYISGLMLNNSLVSNIKVEFIPVNGKRVNWYTCGPTVYDSAHLGHARTYLTFDVIRRVMEDYFGYDVYQVMNITDIDDKIIKRANEGNYSNFLELARKYEAEFFSDIKDLKIKLPDNITRVSEYIPEIIEFITTIITRGYAYESDGSVYFDINTFRENEKHCYGRLEPYSVTDQTRVLEGEGELGLHLSDKRSPFDFALWKKAKENEPSWDSPWGKGRPGWHIECSTMASNTLGFPVDIHCGGIDLRFPHHENELAQSEAHYDQPQWINYFLHSGHLHIHGFKMSKSLKNFLTIREILDLYSFRHIRLFFLLHKWDAPVNFSLDTSLQEAVAIDQTFINFFANVNSRMKLALLMNNTLKHGLEEEKLRLATETAADKIDEYLKDNINTPEVINALQFLINVTNSYMNNNNDNKIVIPILKRSALYVYKILKVFGLCDGPIDSFKYEDLKNNADINLNDTIAPFIDLIAESRLSFKTKAINLMSLTKKQMKLFSSDTNNKEENKEYLDKIYGTADDLLKLSDNIRNIKLPELNVILEDRQDSYLWKLSTNKK